MTELNLLYGGGDDFMLNKADEKPSRISGQQIHQLASQNMQPSYEEQLQSAQQSQFQAQQAQMAQAQMAQAHMAQAQQAQLAQSQMAQAQQAQLAQNDMMSSVPTQYMSQKKRAPEYSFWDRMNLKRSEVIKLALFSLVIVLGIAIDRIGTHYISKYISENILTDVQEFLLRLSYPIVVFLLLWVLKAV